MTRTRQTALIVVLGLAVIRVAQGDTVDRIVPLLQKHCFKCHGKTKQTAQLNLEQAVGARPLVQNLRLWRNVIRQLREAEMPPDDFEHQPTAAQRKNLLGVLEKESSGE